jgi:hypothetical protein
VRPQLGVCGNGDSAFVGAGDYEGHALVCGLRITHANDRRRPGLIDSPKGALFRAPSLPENRISSISRNATASIARSLSASAIPSRRITSSSARRHCGEDIPPCASMTRNALSFREIGMGLPLSGGRRPDPMFSLCSQSTVLSPERRDSINRKNGAGRPFDRKDRTAPTLPPAREEKKARDEALNTCANPRSAIVMAVIFGPRLFDPAKTTIRRAAPHGGAPRSM